VTRSFFRNDIAPAKREGDRIGAVPFDVSTSKPSAIGKRERRAAGFMCTGPTYAARFQVWTDSKSAPPGSTRAHDADIMNFGVFKIVTISLNFSNTIPVSGKIYCVGISR